MSDQNQWVSFVNTTLATVTGAGLSGLVAWSIYRHESKERIKALRSESDERYEARLTDALVHVNYEIAKYLTKGRFLTRNFTNENKTIGLSFLAAASVARGRDLEMVLAMQDACLEAENGTSEKQAILLITIAASISGWRSHMKPYEFYFDQIRGLIAQPQSKTESPSQE